MLIFQVIEWNVTHGKRGTQLKSENRLPFLVNELDISFLQVFQKVLSIDLFFYGIGGLAKAVLTFVISIVLKFSVYSHFAIFSSISSNVVIHYTHPVSQLGILKPLRYCVYNSWVRIVCFQPKFS